MEELSAVFPYRGIRSVTIANRKSLISQYENQVLLDLHYF